MKLNCQAFPEECLKGSKHKASVGAVWIFSRITQNKYV